MGQLGQQSNTVMKTVTIVTWAGVRMRVVENFKLNFRF